MFQILFNKKFYKTKSSKKIYEDIKFLLKILKRMKIEDL